MPKQPATQQPLKQGQILAGKYRVGAVLSRGSYGTVFEATRLDDGRNVVVKALQAEATDIDPAAGERFLREAAVAASFEHPNLVRVHDFGQTRDQVLYITMERLHGQPLAALMYQEPLAPRAAQDIVRQLLSAMTALHGRGLAHRDLQPMNIFACDPGSVSLTESTAGDTGHHIKVIDFGTAKGTDDKQTLMSRSLTEKGIRVGTPGYIAPELLRRGGKLTPLVDLYATGIIGHELLTGEAAFKGKGLDIVIAQTKGDPTPPPGFDASQPLYQLIMTLFARNPVNRCSSAQTALDQLLALGA